MSLAARFASPLTSLVLATGLAACSSSGADTGSEASSGEASGSESETGEGPADYSEAGPHRVGNQRFELVDDGTGRALPVELWYPSSADQNAANGSITDFVTDPTHAQAFADLVDAAPADCTRRQTFSAPDAPLAGPDLAGAQLPLIVFSHCHACSRFSTFSVAERLASHGFVVAAVDHVDNTILDELEGDTVDVSAEFLQTRGADMGRLLDAMLADAGPVPEAFHARIDATRVGIYGHSFGAATAGLVLQDDDRVRAGVAIGAPMESLLLPGVEVAQISEPVLMLLATEDNSITEFGNNFIRDNFAQLPGPAWLVEVVDAGHWSFTDICGVIDIFSAGCGEGERQTLPGENFTYIDNQVARDLTADYVAGFFALQLLGDESARTLLDDAHPSGATTVESHD